MPITLLTLLFYIVLGLGLAYLVNSLSDHLPRTRQPAPMGCPQCGATARTLLVLLGWQRVCRTCGYQRTWRAAVLYLLALAAALWLWYMPPLRVHPLVAWLLLAYFAVVTVIDLEHRLILHPVSAAGAVLCGVIGIWRRGWFSTLLGGAAGFGAMLLLYLLGELFARWMARRRGEPLEDEVALGFGDVNLAGVIGLLLGYPGIVAGLTLTILLGGGVSFLYLLWMLARQQYRAFTAIPYGPFLVAAAIILFFSR